MDKIKTNWRKIEFGSFIKFNPSVKLRKNVEYPFVEMDDIHPENRYVTPHQNKKYKGGGSKFENYDTLFARITPSLEHGKISQVKNLEGRVGFGSTEFFVFRGKENISDNNFVYYLSTSYKIRKNAENSMFGASGRQRVDKNYLKNVKIFVPNSIQEQKEIASILSNYDDLIENNIRRIQILEKIAKIIYDEWFVNFKFPGHENIKIVDSELGKIPEGWEIGKLGDIIDLTMGQSPKSQFYNERGDGLPFHQGVKDFGFRFPEVTKYCSKELRIANQDDILFSVRAPVGRINIANQKIIIGRGLSSIRHKYGYQSFLLYHLKHYFSRENIIGNGAIFASVTKSNLKNFKIIIPEHLVVKKFDEFVNLIDEEIKNLTLKNKNLHKTRDLLLPKLINGEIDVSNLDIKTNEGT